MTYISKLATIESKTPAMLRGWANRNRKLALQVVAAKAFAQVERERVDAYVKPIFETYTFLDHEGQKITNIEHLFTCPDEALCKTFYDVLDDAHARHGWKGDRGYCPALVAESALIKAENALLIKAEEFVGIETILMEHRRALIELAMKICLHEVK